MEGFTDTQQDCRIKRGDLERNGLQSLIAHEENWSRASTEHPSHDERHLKGKWHAMQATRQDTRIRKDRCFRSSGNIYRSDVGEDWITIGLTQDGDEEAPGEGKVWGWGGAEAGFKSPEESTVASGRTHSFVTTQPIPETSQGWISRGREGRRRGGL